MGAYFRLQVYESIWISLVEVYERVGKSVISISEKKPKGFTDDFFGCEIVEKNILVLWFIHILTTVHLQQLIGMQSSIKSSWKEYHLSIEGIWMPATGVPFPSKMVYIGRWNLPA